MSAFEQACEIAGGVTVLAERMSAVSGKVYAQSRLSNWKKTGVPGECVIDVARAVSYLVAPHDLRPDIYPNPCDGLPLDDARRAGVAESLQQ